MTPPPCGRTTAGVETQAYQVLARKYRPQTFEDLIGQDAMVRTLANAFAAGRIAHAFMLTGVRGVGKTTTARLLARALNFRRGEEDAPQLALDPPGEECEAIAAGRHPDVMEMDAASRTGVGDIREILDGVRYAPARARYKIYVIDEVHMLSTSAFNALLKTLEEPPAHVKFIFATTEIRKVPVTVLSRCQRFDLKRVPLERLATHLARVCDKEGAAVAEDGLTLIARAAEGSVRDALSMLDQAIVLGQETGGGRKAKGAKAVSATQVRDMLGLADRGRTLDIFAAVARGDGPAAIHELAAQYEAGADPAVVMRDVLDHCHAVTRATVLQEAARFTDAEEYVARIREVAGATSLGPLARLWQMLLKAHEEVRAAPDPLAAAEMALLRIAYAAGLPPPEEAARLLAGAGAAPGPSQTAATPQPAGAAAPASRVDPPHAAQPEPEEPETGEPETWEPETGEPEPLPPYAAEPSAPFEPDRDETDDARHAIGSWADIIALAGARRDIMLQSELERTARPIRVEPGQVVFQPTADARADLSARLSRALSEWTQTRWLVSADEHTTGGETTAEARAREKAALWAAAKQDPLVLKALELWPGAEIVDVRERPALDDDAEAPEAGPLEQKDRA